MWASNYVTERCTIMATPSCKWVYVHQVGLNSTYGFHNFFDGDRSNTICTNAIAREGEISHIQRVLSISGYTKDAWLTATKPHASTVPTDLDKNPSKGSITLPYVGPLSESMARVIHKVGAAVHMKPFNMIRSKLVHPKDKVKKEDKSGKISHTV